MMRVKELVSESAINEADVVVRNPLRPTFHGSALDRDTVMVDDFRDDIDTLDGRINARGRAEPLRSQYVDLMRMYSNRKNLCDKYIPLLAELQKSLEAEGFPHVAQQTESLMNLLEEEVEPDKYDVDYVRSTARHPIHVGDAIMGRPEYVGFERAWGK